MRTLLRITSIGLLLAMAGCIPSLHPLYTGQDLLFDQALVGRWENKENTETWTFTKGAGRGYKLVYVDAKGKEGEFVAHLLKVGDRMFLDLYPAGPDPRQNDFYKFHLLRVHTFMRVSRIGPDLRMEMLNPDWIKRVLEKEADAVRHEKVEGGILLTAQPKEMQAFLIKHEKTAEAWDKGSPMTRQPEKSKD